MGVAVRIIPCLDVAGGRVVKGVNFEGLRDAGDPVEAAARYDSEGADEIAFLDITSSSVPLLVGGGVRSADDVRALLLAGADKVSVNSAAVARPELVAELAERFGSQCITVAVDAKRAGDGWEIFTHGGRRATGIDAVGFARRVAALGAGEILLTSMDRDGTRGGYDLPLTRAVADAVTVPVVASGGVGSLDDLVAGVTRGRASAVLAASLFHFGEASIAEARAALAAAGARVRRL